MSVMFSVAYSGILWYLYEREGHQDVGIFYILWVVWDYHCHLKAPGSLVQSLVWVTVLWSLCACSLHGSVDLVCLVQFATLQGAFQLSLSCVHCSWDRLLIHRNSVQDHLTLETGYTVTEHLRVNVLAKVPNHGSLAVTWFEFSTFQSAAQSLSFSSTAFPLTDTTFIRHLTYT